MADKAAKQPILVPVDFSEASEAALLKAFELAECLKVRVVVLHVVHDPGDMPGYYSAMVKKKKFGRMQDAARVMLEDFILEFRKKYNTKQRLKRAERMLVIGLPVTRILQVAKKIDASFVVMGSKGETGIKHLMLGSVAERVVQLCPLPVMVVKVAPQEEAS
ncbi:MAG: universal stress protein [Candidatus Thiodiazotropha sp. (ex. Lucinisca nassula)]|uniref:universal stress protein n=1 Tax=Candidatus Thiodiazotropha sp. LNASS1 TaxID=3096260 RepID=UPI002812DCA9|nr:universal stress protein [Candidatus Thiodiazotropha sp. (ex. Lucinisca nassula)]